MGIVILGIESSCDDTSAAILKDGVVLSNIIASQKVHEAYGGVVPELASRAHQQNIIPVVAQALKQAGVSEDEVNAVAFTRGSRITGLSPCGNVLCQRIRYCQTNTHDRG